MTKLSRPLVILVEDNYDDQIIAQRAISKAWPDLDLKIARDGVDALELIQNSPILPTLVLMDLKLPKMDGLEVLETLRKDERTAQIPVVMLTSSTEARDIASCYRLGANSYIQKTLDFNEFVEHVRSILHYWIKLNVSPE